MPHYFNKFFAIKKIIIMDQENSSNISINFKMNQILAQILNFSVLINSSRIKIMEIKDLLR